MTTSHEDLARALGRVEGKLDQLIDTVVPEQHNHDERLRALEKEKNIRYARESMIAGVLAWVGWPTIQKWFGF